jgi:hypothetical protein
MLSVAHIVNPVIVPGSSDLFIAQPVTFETMRRARATARDDADVVLLSAQFPEDRALVPDDFVATPDLERSALDLGEFKIPRKLPLLKDILDRLYEHTPHADVLIYTNVDIALMPHFYTVVERLIDQGLDALVINRRTISSELRGIDAIPLMYAHAGKPHSGYDCFVFRRDLYPRFRLGDVLIGAPHVGNALRINLFCNAEGYKRYKNLHLTFHLGNDQVWRSDKYGDYAEHNMTEFQRILSHYAPCLDSAGNEGDGG